MEKKKISKTFYYDTKADLKLHTYMFRTLYRSNERRLPKKLKRSYKKLSQQEKEMRRKMKFLSSMRNKDLIHYWNSNPYLTLREAGTEFDITRERVRQLLKKAKVYGLEVLPRASRSELKKKADIEKVASEIEYALKNLYGNPTFFIWAKAFRKKATPIQSKFLRTILIKCWQNNILDPLDYVEFKLRPKDRHFEVIKLVNKGYTLNRVAKKINRSKPLVCNILREARALGIHPKTTGTRLNQVHAVSLDKDVINKRLNLIRDHMKEGKTISDIERLLLNGSLRHFISRHYHLPRWEENRSYKLA